MLGPIQGQVEVMHPSRGLKQVQCSLVEGSNMRVKLSKPVVSWVKVG